MCGSNSQQTAAQAQEAAFSQQMMQENATVFGQQQSILSTLNAGFQKIIANGPSQEGFSASELTNMQSMGTEDTAMGETNAMMALGQGQAAEGGGNTFVPSGVKDEQRQEVATAGAASNTQTQEGIVNADYAQGNANYNNAVAGSETVAADLNPVGYSQATTSSNVASADEANAIAASANSPFTAVMGALGGLAGAAATAYTGKPPCWVAAELFGGWEEPRTVDVRRWMVEQLPKTALGSLVLEFYKFYGERWAAAIKRRFFLRFVSRAIFQVVLHVARKGK